MSGGKGSLRAGRGSVGERSPRNSRGSRLRI